MEWEQGSSQPVPGGLQDEDAPSPESEDPPDSQGEVEDILSTLVEQGGVGFLNQLLAKAVPPDLESLDISKIREWSYKDILYMSKVQQKEWTDACQQELDSLCKHDIYNLVVPLPGRKIIKNR